MISPRIFGALCLVIVGAAACAKESPLYSRLDERQANEIMAVLLEHEIDCSKAAGEENTWDVSVSSDRFSDAVELLKTAGLPSQEFVGVGQMFQKSGMVSSPTEERIRFMYALAQDLSATLTQIDGVIAARVHVVLPENDPFRKEVKPSSASVFIKHRYDSDMESRIPFIKNLVKDGIEGLDYDNISVALFRADPPSVPDLEQAETDLAHLWGFWVAPQSISGLRVVLFGLAAVAALGLVGCGVLAYLHFVYKPKTGPAAPA